MKTTLRTALRRVMGKTRSQKSAHFRLEYLPVSGGEAVTVGHLRFGEGWWSFEYSPEYQRRTDLRPIEGFDDLHKVYRSKSLFPFFAVRIPGEDRPDVRRLLKQQHIESPDDCDLLRVFGRRAAASPAFELVES